MDKLLQIDEILFDCWGIFKIYLIIFDFFFNFVYKDRIQCDQFLLRDGNFFSVFIFGFNCFGIVIVCVEYLKCCGDFELVVFCKQL